jgi:hypothetical protein
MSLLQSGKIFNDGEQLTAGKLNQILSDATLSTSGVDGSTIIVNQNDSLAVRSGGIGSSSLATNSVITDKIKDQNVTTGKLKDQSVTTNKINDYDVTTIKIKDLNVTTNKLADGSVTAAKLATNALEFAYPVGSVYMNMTSNVNPSTFLGFGTWTLFSQGTFLAGFKADDTAFDAVGYEQNTQGRSGERNVTLTQAQMYHNHEWNLRVSDGNNERNFIKMQRVTNNNRDVSFNSAGNQQDYSDPFEMRQNTFTSLNKDVTGSTSTASHENMPPYFVVYMWRRQS